MEKSRLAPVSRPGSEIKVHGMEEKGVVPVNIFAGTY